MGGGVDSFFVMTGTTAFAAFNGDSADWYGGRGPAAGDEVGVYERGSAYGERRVWGAAVITGEMAAAGAYNVLVYMDDTSTPDG